MLYWGACLLTININLPTNEQDGYISNVAFFKALLIKEYIESKRLSNKCKEETMNKVLEYLQKTWIAFWRELESHQILEGWGKYEKENKNCNIF